MAEVDFLIYKQASFVSACSCHKLPVELPHEYDLPPQHPIEVLPGVQGVPVGSDEKPTVFVVEPPEPPPEAEPLLFLNFKVT